jgi:integrase
MTTGHIRRRGASSWEIKYDLPRCPKTGRRQTRYATAHGTKADARRKLRELLSAVDQGVHVDRTRTSIAEFTRERIASWECSARTAEHYATVALLIERHIGGIELQRLTTIDVENWHGELRARGLSRCTIGHAQRMLKRVYKDAMRHGLAVRNPAAEQPAPKVERTEIEIVAADRIQPTLAKLEGTEWYAPVIVALYCGLRRSEQLALKWNSVDLDGAKLHVREALEETVQHGIRVKAPKSAAGRRTVSLPRIVVDALREHRKAQLERCLLLGLGRPSDDALVFPDHNGGHISPRLFSLRWLRTVRRLKLPAGSWHAWRHTHASQLIAAGVDVVTVSKRLGHSSPAVTLGIYSHLFHRDDRPAAEAIDAALGQ